MVFVPFHWEEKIVLSQRIYIKIYKLFQIGNKCERQIYYVNFAIERAYNEQYKSVFDLTVFEAFVRMYSPGTRYFPEGICNCRVNLENRYGCGT